MNNQLDQIGSDQIRSDQIGSDRISLYGTVRYCMVRYITIHIDLIKVGFPPSLTVMAIFFAEISLKYGYLCIIFAILPMSAKKEIFFYVPVDIFFSTLKKIKRDLSIITSFFYC